MKRIKKGKGNELLLKGYEIDELKDDIKNSIIREHKHFLKSLGYNNPTNEEVKEDLNQNGHLFTEEGKPILITYHTKSGRTTKTTLRTGGKQIEVNIV